ncbi:MAG: hypothetical protein K2M83_13295 [Muribaculaceae bacterium]|nr:hypothetical protein [Muribaculaceae bacterium]MDE6194945.1 hypothetical protein [Muribaculaceae bacterium]
MAKIHYLIAIFLIFLFSSCKSEQSKILSQADSVMESRPDSAMTLLESIDRSRLTQSELPYYALLYTQAQVKTDVPLDSDSLISIAFAKYGDTPKDDRGLRANFYTGEVLFNRQKNPQAMRYFLTVYEESKRLGNNYWRAKAAERISDLFYFAYNYDEAEKYAQEAAQLFKVVEKQTFYRYTLAKLAIYFINNGKNQRAYSLLDSLQQVCINEHPIDSLFLTFISLPLIDAAVQTGNIEKIKTINIDSDELSLDESIVIDQLYEDSGNFEKAMNNLGVVDTVGFSNDEKLHYLYALYKNAEALGDKSRALSYVDSLLILQSKVTEDVIKESVTGAQRDFYSGKAFQEEERNASLRYQIITIVIAFIIILALISVILFQKHKAYKTKSESDLEAIMSLISESKGLAHEKYELQSSLNEKGVLINQLNNKIKASLRKIEALTLEIADKDSKHGHLQELLSKKDAETIRLQTLLTQKDYEYENIQVMLSEKIDKEISQTVVIETLFREKWITLDKLCAEYFSLNNSEISSKVLLESINKEVQRVTSEKGIQEIVAAVDIYMGGIITLLRNQCQFLKETDINYIALVYAGFTVKAVCLFLDIKYQHFFVKKSRLIRRIQKSDAQDKDLFISKFK